MRRRDFLGLGAGAIAGLAFAPPFAEAKLFNDSGGRKINVPDEVHRVFPRRAASFGHPPYGGAGEDAFPLQT